HVDVETHLKAVVHVQRVQAAIYNFQELQRVQNANASNQKREENHLSTQVFCKSAHTIDDGDYHCKEKHGGRGSKHCITCGGPSAPLHQALCNAIDDGK